MMSGIDPSGVGIDQEIDAHTDLPAGVAALPIASLDGQHHGAKHALPFERCDSPAGILENPIEGATEDHVLTSARPPSPARGLVVALPAGIALWGIIIFLLARLF